MNYCWRQKDEVGMGTKTEEGNRNKLNKTKYRRNCDKGNLLVFKSLFKVKNNEL